MEKKYQEYLPQLWTCFKEGYNKKFFISDLFAGISVGVIALPLALAFAIGSGVTPERGLFTAIIAGFLISFLGGSRVQIGGPTGAFVIVVYTIIQKHGYEGLALATIMGGLIMIVMGLARFGLLLKFIPFPVTTGFTTGIALIILTSQIKDFFGLQIDTVPPQFLKKCTLYCTHAGTWSAWASLIASGTLLLMILLRKYYPKLPGAIIAIIIATVICSIVHLPVETIEAKFGSIPRVLPEPTLPTITYDLIKKVFPDAITIALLGAIESLLSAVVADGLTGYRHRPNCELVGQGIANIGSIIFGGIPATGAIARTSANIRMGANTPIAGMTHALTLLMLMLLFAPLAAKIPLCALSAVLIYVAWNMSELGHFIEILKSQRSEALILLITFLLTVLIDLSVAVQVGVLLAAVLFVKKMTDTTTVEACRLLLAENNSKTQERSNSSILCQKEIPEGVTVFEIKGPFFYCVADLLNETLIRQESTPKVFILRMDHVPIIDTTAIKALKDFKGKCDQKKILFLLSGFSDALKERCNSYTLESVINKNHILSDIDSALSFARSSLQLSEIQSAVNRPHPAPSDH